MRIPRLTDLGRAVVAAVAAVVVIATASALAGCTAPDTSTTPDSGAGPAASTTATSEQPTPTTAPPTLDYDFAETDSIVEQFVLERGLNGAGLVIVDRDDGIIHQGYWGEFEPERVSLIASASKMLVAGVLLRLDDQGLLDVNAPVSDAVEWGEGNPLITPAQLISNTSGLVGLAPNPVYPPYLCQYLPVGDLQDCAAAIFTTTDDDDDVVAPDTEFRYGGGQWQVAGGIAEAVSGMSWSELLDDTYATPCGITSLGFNNHWAQLGAAGFDYPRQFDGDPSTLTATANPNIEGGAYITAIDYAKVLLMHLRNGTCGENQVLSQRALDLMHTDRVGVIEGAEAPLPHYAMGWFVDQTTGRLTDPGAYGAVAWLDLDAGHGGFLVIEADGNTGSDLSRALFEPVAQAIGTARGEP